MRCCSAYVSEGFDEVHGMAASLDLSPFSLYLEQPRQSGGGREEKWCGWPCAQVLSWKSHSPVPHQMALQLAHTPPPVPALSACLRGVVSLPRFRRRQLRGRISKDSGRRRRDGRALCSSSLQGTLARRRAHKQKQHVELEMMMQLPTGLEADLLPRSGLCSPSSMAQPEPSMACNASVVTHNLDCLPAELPRETRELLSLSRPPSRSSSSSRSLSRVAVCGERPCRWMEGHLHSDWLAG